MKNKYDVIALLGGMAMIFAFMVFAVPAAIKAGCIADGMHTGYNAAAIGELCK